MPDATISAEVEPDVKQSLRVAAARNGISMSEFVRLAIVEKLERESEGNAIPTPVVS